MQRLRLWLAMMGMMLGRPFGLRMRSCREVVQLLSDYLDGELSLEPRRSLDLHLLACPACQNYVDTLRQTQTLVSAIRYEEIPTEFRSRLHAVLVERLGGSA